MGNFHLCVQDGGTYIQLDFDGYLSLEGGTDIYSQLKITTGELKMNFNIGLIAIVYHIDLLI